MFFFLTQHHASDQNSYSDLRDAVHEVLAHMESMLGDIGIDLAPLMEHVEKLLDIFL